MRVVVNVAVAHRAGGLEEVGALEGEGRGPSTRTKIPGIALAYAWAPRMMQWALPGAQLSKSTPLTQTQSSPHKMSGSGSLLRHCHLRSRYLCLRFDAKPR